MGAGASSAHESPKSNWYLARGYTLFCEHGVFRPDCTMCLPWRNGKNSSRNAPRASNYMPVELIERSRNRGHDRSPDEQQIPWLAKDLLQTDKELVEALLANEKDLDGSDGGQKKYRPTRNSEGIYKIMDGLYISGIEGAKDYMTLQRARVTHILNMAGPSVYDHHRAGGREKSYFPQLFVYKIITSYDKPEQDLLQYFPETSLFIQKGRMSGGILVHCHAGVSRSVAVIMAYMIDTLKLDAVTAFDVLKRGRPQAHPNVGFQKQIKQYEAMHVGGGPHMQMLQMQMPHIPMARVPMTAAANETIARNSMMFQEGASQMPGMPDKTVDMSMLGVPQGSAPVAMRM